MADPVNDLEMVAPRLTPRDCRIIRALVAGKTNRQIAEHLKLREQTIKNRLSALYAKFGVRNRLQLVLHTLNDGKQER